MSTHDDEHGSGTDPRYHRPAQQYGPPQYGTGGPAQPYEGQQGEPYGHGPGGTQGYGQGPAGYPPYGQQVGYGQYAAPAQYGGYGQYGQYGQTAAPARPTPVVVAAVLGFAFSALGGLMGLGLLLGGALVATVIEDLAASDPTLSDVNPGELGQVTDLAQWVAIGFGVLALLWAALMVWGSVRALSGRSRVLLLVGGAIAVAVTALLLLAVLSELSTGGVGGGEVLFFLLFFLAALAMVVLLSLPAAAQYYAAHRARRAR